MPKICYKPTKFNASSKTIIDQANAILDEYREQGYVLTLRQLYYQFVSRDYLANTTESYKRLGSIINDARLAGLIDWSMMEDRTRDLKKVATWNKPADIISVCAHQFAIDKWKTQAYRPEVWIEKEALAGVFERICTSLQVPYFCCKGYTSQSAMWEAGQRLLRYQCEGQKPIIFHFGDHDPSGMDMTRDISDRLEMFTHGEVKLKRLALTMDQVEEHDPPPNPAKLTDSRVGAYIRAFGDKSWELDALSPQMLSDLVETHIQEITNAAEWEAAEEQEQEGRRLLSVVSEKWDKLTRKL